jgi:predicted nuclease of predicted toxin-antitoxin system
VKFLVDECLHTSLVAVAEARGHEARHVNWLGLSGETDWGLMPRILDEDFTFVTNNARDSESSTRARNFTQVCSSSFPRLHPISSGNYLMRCLRSSAPMQA